MSKFNIIKLDAIGSTNDWLKDKFLKGECDDNDVVWVRNQTHGRGQRSMIWVSEAGKNLTFSIFKHFQSLPVSQFFLINCAVTLAILKVLTKYDVPDLKLKWPNDILSDNKKIGGVLIENFMKGDSLTGTIIGVGINVNQQTFNDLPHAGSMLLQTNKSFKISRIFEELLQTFDTFFDGIDHNESGSMLSAFQKHMYKRGEWNEFKDNKGYFQARILGINDKGHLLVEKTSGKVKEYSNGSIEMIY